MYVFQALISPGCLLTCMKYKIANKLQIIQYIFENERENQLHTIIMNKIQKKNYEINSSRFNFENRLIMNENTQKH